MLVEAVKHGDKKRRRFARASASHGNDVGARKDEGHGLPLNRSGHFVPFVIRTFFCYFHVFCHGGELSY